MCINKSIKENTIVNKNLRVSVFVNEINLNGALVLQAEYFVKSVDSEKIKYEKQWLLLKILEACTKNDCSIYEKYK